MAPFIRLAFLLAATGLVDAPGEGQPLAQVDAGSTPKDPPAPLAMTRAVVCRSIEGFENFEALPGSSLTADEKLLIYYRPLNYTIVREAREYRVHLTQDGQIRRAGEKLVLRSKEKILDYAPRSREPMGPIFLKNAVPLKGLPPGDYEYDILLRDENQSGPPARQSVKFRIVRAELPASSRTGRSGSRKSSKRPRPAEGDQGAVPFSFDGGESPG